MRHPVQTGGLEEYENTVHKIIMKQKVIATLFKNLPPYSKRKAKIDTYVVNGLYKRR